MTKNEQAQLLAMLVSPMLRNDMVPGQIEQAVSVAAEALEQVLAYVEVSPE